LNNFYGVAAEVWPNDRVFLGGGIGLGVYGSNPLLSNGTLR